MKRLIALSAIMVSTLIASGWRIPEQSVNSMALSGAYVAAARGADASYFNPANMSFNDKEKRSMELDLNYIGLSKIKYKDNTTSIKDGNSKKESFYIPTFFASSCERVKGFRFGFSLTTPGGLSKRWEDPYQKLFAKEFTLKIIEFNPVVSYLINQNFSIGGGLRAIYSEGVVKSDGGDFATISGASTNIKRELEGNTLTYGYNLAATYKLNNSATFGITYRSNVDLKEDGNAKLYVSNTKVYDGGASVTVPLPAVLSVAYAQDINKMTVEFVYEKTFWSKYKDLDFEYDSPIPVILKSSFDDPQDRDWSDTNTYRLGLTYKNNNYDFMCAVARDESPAPEKNVGFESALKEKVAHCLMT